GRDPITVQTLLESFVVPQVQTQPTWLIDPLIEFVFNHATFSDTWFKNLEVVAFVRVGTRNGSTSIRLQPSHVIKKSARIAELYFDDEPVFGNEIYGDDGPYQRHLEFLGTKSQFDATIAADRIERYSIPTNQRLF